MKKIISFLLIVSFSVSLSFAQDNSNINNLRTLEELQDSIQKILIKTNTPGAGIAMVSGDSIVLLRGFGKADIEDDIDVSENTLFRLGSVSKLFVSLAILKLQEEGQLNLKDKVSDLIPDLEIINPWEDKYPITIENLLEHTAGLNDWSFAEIGSNDPKPKNLKESLEYYPKGRVARFVPGTRIQYSNLGVSIAAYIVERISGMTYEDYIKKYFFKPMGMKNMTFRNSEQYQKTGAKGYDNGTQIPYLHSLYRPSTALIGSPKEIINLLKFFIRRGKVDGIELISESSLKRMEHNESLNIENSKLFNRHGLGNAPSYYKNFIYRGHGGSVPGSNADFSYLPEYNLGYAIMINGENPDVEHILSDLIKQYQTKDLPKETVKINKAIYKSNQDLSGYYIAVNYKFDLFKFKDKIKSLTKIWHKDDTLFVKKVLRQYPDKFYPNENNVFKSESGRAFLFQENDLVEGQIIYGNMGMFKKISPIYAYTLPIIFWAFFIVPITIIVFAMFRLLIYLFGKKKDKIALWISLWPLINISFILVIVLYMSLQTRLETFLLLGNISSLSLLIFIGTIGFALSSLWSIYYIFKNRKAKMSKIFYYHSFLVAIFNLIFTIYFFSTGLIGIMTWI